MVSEKNKKIRVRFSPRIPFVALGEERPPRASGAARGRLALRHAETHLDAESVKGVVG
jgi:hypothetical protein